MKTIRKMMINAFEKYARQSGWTDSKKNSCNLSQFGYKSARQWAREIVSAYDLDDLTAYLCEWNECNPEALKQADIDNFVEDEMACY